MQYGGLQSDTVDIGDLNLEIFIFGQAPSIFVNLKYYETIIYLSKTKGEKVSTVKKWLLVFFVIIVIPITVAACAVDCRLDTSKPRELYQTKGEVKTSETIAAAKETAAAAKETAAETEDTLSEWEVNGVICETDLFSILLPDGWKAEEVKTEGSVIFSKGDFEKGGYAVMLQAGDDAGSTEAFLKELLAQTEKVGNGTPVEEVTIGGAKFFQSRGTFDGNYTTNAYGLTNGLVVRLAIMGKDHPNNVEIKAILDSIKFK
jgi:hypothetical protein